MSMWTAITIIVVVAVFGGVLRARWEARHGGETDARLDELAAKIDRLDSDLRARVETLERIVTDRHEDLRREFEYLEKAS